MNHARLTISGATSRNLIYENYILIYTHKNHKGSCKFYYGKQISQQNLLELRRPTQTLQ